MMPKLRDYQARAVALRSSYASGRHPPLLAPPAAAGKMHIFTAVTAVAVAKRRGVLVVAHRRELIRHANSKVADAGVPHGIICAGFDAETPVWIWPNYDAANPIASRVCSSCGYARPEPPAQALTTPGELDELTAEHLAAIRAMSYAQVVREMRSEAELRAYSTSRDYHSGWVRHLLREQREAVS